MTAPELRDADLIRWMEATASGDLPARDALVTALLPAVEARARRLQRGRSREHAEELMAQVTEWLLTTLPPHCQRFDAALGPPFPWLWRLVRQQCNRYLRDMGARKRSREVGVEAPLDPPDPGPGADEDVHRGELARAFARFGASLGDPDREVFFCRLAGEESSRAVGERLGLNPGAVDKRAHRLRDALYKWLMREGLEPALLLILTTIYLMRP